MTCSFHSGSEKLKSYSKPKPEPTILSNTSKTALDRSREYSQTAREGRLKHCHELNASSSLSFFFLSVLPACTAAIRPFIFLRSCSATQEVADLVERTTQSIAAEAASTIRSSDRASGVSLPALLSVACFLFLDQHFSTRAHSVYDSLSPWLDDELKPRTGDF